jgi:hypothetical protein
MTDPLSSAWASWPRVRDHNWTLFVTATFPWQIAPEGADRLWRKAMNELAKRVMSARSARETGLPWLRGLESHQNGNPHIHAVISGATQEQVKEIWAQTVSGKALIRVETFEPKYGLKYITKSGNVDLSRFFRPA